MADPKRFALIAHDAKKDDLVAWVRRHLDPLRPHLFWATGTTGSRILEAVPELRLTRLKSGPLGGDQQVGAMIANGEIDILVFFTDPLSPHPHDVDVKALARVATIYDIPAAYNPATADLIIRSPFLDPT